MFIYHFSRLIKSKLIWGFLALLMVFAFVVADSCRSTSADSNAAGYLNGTPITYTESESAAKTLEILTNQPYYLPYAAQIYGALLQGTARGEATVEQRRRAIWKVLAAREVAARNHLQATQNGAERVLERAFAGENGAFNPLAYRAFLGANQYQDPRLFEKTYASVWLPSQLATLAVFNAVGWVSPMEQTFTLDALYDNTVAYALTLPNTLKPEEIETPEADLQAWYTAHPEPYTLPEQRTIAYVEIPAAAFAEKIVVEELDAMQYYDDHSEEFKGTGDKSATTLPFEEVKEKAVAKVREQRALEEAQTYTNETLVAKAHVAGLAEAAAAYGQPQQATLRQDRPFGFQNARDLVSAVFEMDTEENNLNAVVGTDRVYLVKLETIVPKHVEPLEAVRARVKADLQRDLHAARQKARGEEIRAKLAEALAKEPAIDKAVAACAVEGLTLSPAMTFVLNDAAKLEIDHRAEVLAAVGTLGAKALSEPILLAGNDLLFVYVDSRTPGDVLAKTANRPMVAQPRNTPFMITADWLDWALDRDAPTTARGVPILVPESEGAPDEE